MRRLGRIASLGLLVLTLAACGEQAPASRETPSVLNPQGDGATIIAHELRLEFAIASAVFVVVIGLLAGIVVCRLRRDPDEATWSDQRSAYRWVILGGVALPVIVLSAIVGVTVNDLGRLTDPPQRESLTIEVIGHRWWWEVRYPAQSIVSANEIVIPVGETVKLRLESRDVIHSFWVPQLQRKMDLLPGSWNTIWLRATTGGVFRGVCSQFCGIEHARMHVLVRAMPPASFAAWLNEAAQPAQAPQQSSAIEGRTVFLSHSCAYCHMIAGTPASGQVGPDLTHVASRLTLAAGMLPNTRGNLAGWISDPQSQKPGVNMPRTELNGRDLQALINYLRILR
jgi:cytochrome c oxidase subunit 2